MTDPRKLENYIARDPDGRIWQHRVCIIPPGQGLPGHPCVGPNRVVEFDGFFDIQGLIKWTREAAPRARRVPFGDIWLQSHHEDEARVAIETDRYRNADTTFPGLLAVLPNPGNKPYRMLDGRHRLWKMQNEGLVEGDFYIVPGEIAFRHFWLPMSMQSLVKNLG